MSLCVLIATESGYVCTQCKRPSTRLGKRNCTRWRWTISGEPCRFTPILSRLTPAGVDNLQRCREAECKMMLPVEGSMRCVGMPGSRCQWIAAWAERLNDEGWECPHYPGQ
jgi:hypothetical protein